MAELLIYLAGFRHLSSLQQICPPPTQLAPLNVFAVYRPSAPRPFQVLAIATSICERVVRLGRRRDITVEKAAVQKS